MKNQGLVFGVCALGLAISGCTTPPGAETALVSAPIGNHTVQTVPVPAGLAVEGATYTPSGKVLVNYTEPGGDDRDIRLATVNDDGTQSRQFFAQAIPERPLDNGLRYMVFPDNERVFLGDFVLECTTSLETCTDPALVPVEYPHEIAEGDHILHRWSEMVIAPDNRHISWTTLLANYFAIVFTGELERRDGGYVITKPQIVSTLENFRDDPDHPDGVLPQPVRGGEVKQFIAGGTGLSLVGMIDSNLPDSVALDLSTGAIDPITHTPGYAETTIFSPDERLGITMTTRFSEDTDPAIIGLLPRPYPAALNMSLNMFAYTYAVTGVRATRSGNVGPALIDIEQSRTQPGYLGVNLNTEDEWVFHSPMSWHPDSTRAMWIEGRRGSEERRIRIVELADYQPSMPVAARPTPERIEGASTDLSIIPGLVERCNDIDVRVYGRASGHIDFRRNGGDYSKVYHDFSDDGEQVWSGEESTRADPSGISTYTADVRLTGSRPGAMDLQITFGPLRGDLPARIIFDPDADGTPLTRGYAEFDGRRIKASDLLP